jgi:methyl-accepting chemotaxis protein
MEDAGIGIIISIILTALAFFVVRGVTAPINRLAEITDKAAGGELETSVDSGATGGEMGNLTRSVATMIANSRNRINYNESVLKGIREPLYVVDANGSVTYVNDDGARFFNTTVTEMMGRKLGDYFSSVDAGSGETYLARCLRTGEVQSGFKTQILIRSNGNTVHVRGSCAPIKDANGRIVGVVEQFQDVTPIMKAEEAAKKAEKDSLEKALFSDSILKGIMEPLFVVDVNGNVTYVNEPGARFFGSMVTEMMGKRLSDYFTTTTDSGSGETYLARCLRTGEVQAGFETQIRMSRTGNSVYIRGSNAPIKDAGGRIVGVVEQFQDISPIIKAEEAAKAAEKDAKEKALFSDSILKSITDAHLVFDMKGNLTYINEVAQKMLAISEREAHGRSIEDVIGAQNSNARKALLEHNNIYNSEGRVVSRGGREIPVMVNVTLLKDLNGNLNGINSMFKDITREKEAKKQLAEITASAHKIAERVADASGNVSSSIVQVMSASKQISESIQQIASGSQSQAKSIENVNKLMHDMSNSIANVTEGARKTSEDAVKANVEARKGSENAKIAIKKMDELHIAVNDSAVIVQDLGEKSKKIGQIVEMITAIAGQTNLLALNAAIEAARAGDAGRGFAVVAEEVRKLAEEAAKAAEEINSLIGEVREQTARAVESMNKGTKEVNESNRIVAESLKSLEDIGRLIDTTAAKAQEIAAMTEKQALDTQRVVKDVEEMAAVIEQSAAGSEEVSASSEETTSTAEQVAGMASELAKIADELKAEVGKLSVE